MAVKRVLKPRGAFVTTASQPFTSALVMSNPAWFRYAWVWEKSIASNFLDASRKPLKIHEDVLVFGETLPDYYPIVVSAPAYKSKTSGTREQYGAFNPVVSFNPGFRLPNSVIRFPNPHTGEHPTEKPVALYEYLIRTYTQPGEVVLDPFAGSATTFIAALNTGRNCIGGDMTREYVDLGNRRIANWRRDSDIEVSPGVMQLGLFAQSA